MLCAYWARRSNDIRSGGTRLGGPTCAPSWEGTPMTAAPAFEPVAPPNRVLRLLRGYPLISYFVIAYAFTAAYDFLVIRPNPDFPSFPRDFGPSIAAFLVTAAIGGQSAVKLLLMRMVLWRVGLRWY